MTKVDSEDKRQPPDNSHHYNFDELLEEEDRKYLLKHGQSIQADSGTVLCHQDQIGNDLFFILHGEVKITKESDDEDIVLGTLGSGDIFGEISALFSAPRIATVTTNKPSVILKMDKDDFIKLLEQAPNLKQVVYKQLGKRKLQTAIQTQHAPN
jgi:CRP/FNR family transcriptional regulator